MTHDERVLVVMAKADEIMADVPDIIGLIVIATYNDPKDGGCCTMHCIRGNRHAAIGASGFILRQFESYEDGLNAEDGRYDAVLLRQKKQERGRK